MKGTKSIKSNIKYKNIKKHTKYEKWGIKYEKHIREKCVVSQKYSISKIYESCRIFHL